MTIFTPAQLRKALSYLIIFHLIIIASSNYLVQLPFTIPVPYPVLNGNQPLALAYFPIHTTWGAFSFPFIFLATDLTVRIFGSVLARKIIFAVMLPGLGCSYVFSVLFSGGAFQGMSTLHQINWFVLRIAFASFTGYVLGQILDVTVFNRLRQMKQWWLAPAASTVFGNAFDTIAFFAIAFYHSPNPFMASHWTEIAMVDYGVKLLISLGLFVPMYGVLLNYLIRKLTQVRPQLVPADDL